MPSRVRARLAKKPSPPVDAAAQKKSAEVARETANAEYIDKVKLYDFLARYIKNYLDERVTGVTFKLKTREAKR